MSAITPVYSKLKNDILESIKNGIILPKEKLPPENELAKKYGISRGSTRVALSELEAEKLIEKKPGIGTIVCDPVSSDQCTNIKNIGIDILSHNSTCSHGYYQGFVKGAKTASQEYNCRIQLIDSDDLNNIEKAGLDGLIIMNDQSKSIEKLIALAKRIPIVSINRLFENSQIGCITIDHTMEAFRATENLIKQGHQKIAYIGDLGYDIQLRQKGYMTALKTYGLPTSQKLIITNKFGDHFLQAVKDLITQEKPTAIFSANGASYVGFIAPIAHELGISIPDDISVISFDDIEGEGFHYGPPLTCIKQPLEKMGYAAISHLANYHGKLINKIFPAELVIRQSCHDISRPKIEMI